MKILDWVDIQFDLSPDPNSEVGRELQTALSLIQQYEDFHHPIPSPQK